MVINCPNPIQTPYLLTKRRPNGEVAVLRMTDEWELQAHLNAMWKYTDYVLISVVPLPCPLSLD